MLLRLYFRSWGAISSSVIRLHVKRALGGGMWPFVHETMTHGGSIRKPGTELLQAMDIECADTIHTQTKEI